MSSAAYAVAIGLTSADIDQLGGTGNVDVFCPANRAPVDGRGLRYYRPT
jgi:hypothetical protein